MLEVSGGAITQLELRIFEPPRLFERLLEGRSYTELLDIVARICGICPVAYQMSAVQATEQCFGIVPSDWVKRMRRLFYCGEWLESHSLHVHFLALPDVLGHASALDMAQTHAAVLERGLKLQSIGNRLIAFLGARSVHPVGACVGGFFKAPGMREAASLLSDVTEGLSVIEAQMRWLADLDLPEHAHSFTAVALQNGYEYPMDQGGHIVSTDGLSIPIESFETHFKEHQKPYSTALHCLLDDAPYWVGPLARMNLNWQHLPVVLLDLLRELGVVFPAFDMSYSLWARMAEMYHALLQARDILSVYEPDSPRIEEIVPKAGVGFGCTEAPRGLLWHRYLFDESGLIRSASIVPPTSQNQACIEADLRASLTCFGLDQPDDALRARAETIVRQYDPCISCATHFIRLSVERL